MATGSSTPGRLTRTTPWWSRPLKWSEVGCTIAHLSCWRQAATRPEKCCLILEDDAVFEPNLVKQLLGGLNQLEAAASGFDLVYLGRVPLEPDEPLMSGIVRPGYSHCTYGYLLTRGGVRLVLEAGLEQALVPVDELLPAMYIAHPREDVRVIFPRRLRILAFEPRLVAQLTKSQAGSDTEGSAGTKN